MKPSAEIVDYIESEIMPQYDGIGGHTDAHIRYVIERSLRFAEQAPGVNIDMVYVIAAYHDLGRLIDNETHNIESGKLLRADKFLREHFSAEDVETMAQAVEDHRASLGHEPRNVYGKIVSSADRVSSVDEMLTRSFDYNRHLHPEFSEDEVIEDVRVHLRAKYAPGGYALKTLYFNDEDFTKTSQRIEEITRDFETFAPVMREHNKKRGVVL